MKISLITAVNNMNDYERYVSSTIEVDEYITIEDAESAADALNSGLDAAVNDICVLVHQDVIFPPRWPESIVLPPDPNFGVLGVWGVNLAGQCVGNVVEPRGHWKQGSLPEEVQSVDELLMIVRRSSGLRFDNELGGWHLYGADLCLQAMDRGMRNYVINAPVEHLSMGKIDYEFKRIEGLLKEKWQGRSQYNWPCELITTFKTPNTEVKL